MAVPAVLGSLAPAIVESVAGSGILGAFGTQNNGVRKPTLEEQIEQLKAETAQASAAQSPAGVAQTPLDMTTGPYVPEAQISSQVLDQVEAPLAAAPVAPIQTGTQTFMPSTPELEAAQANMAKAYGAEQAAMKASLPELEKIAAEQGVILNADVANNERLRAQEAEARAKADAEIAAAQAEYEVQKQEYASADPKTFWKKAGTADKIGMALAIIVGGAAGGGRGNVALDAMNSAIQQDWAEQQAALQQKLKLVDMSKASVQEKQAAKDRLSTQFQAYQAASLAQTKAKLQSLEPRVTLAAAKEKIATGIAQLEQKSAEIDSQFQQKRAGMIEQKVFGNLQKQAAFNQKFAPPVETPSSANPPPGAAGVVPEKGPAPQPWGAGLKDLTVEQGNSANFLNVNEPNFKILEDIERSLTPSELKALREATQVVIEQEDLNSIPGIGKGINSIRNVIGTPSAQVYERALPGLGGKYYQALYSLTRDQVRDESGAVIGAQEFIDTLKKYAPNTTSSLSDMQQTRRNLLTSHQVKLGDRTRQLYFRQPKESK